MRNKMKNYAEKLCSEFSNSSVNFSSVIISKNVQKRKTKKRCWGTWICLPKQNLLSRPFPTFVTFSAISFYNFCLCVINQKTFQLHYDSFSLTCILSVWISYFTNKCLFCCSISSDIGHTANVQCEGNLPELYPL